MDKMRVTVENLGAVNKGTFELKPLTVFIGNNNTGKTWTAYGVASIFSFAGRICYTKKFKDGNTDDNYPDIEDLIKTLFEKGNSNINIINFLKNNWVLYFNNVAKKSNSWMKTFFGARDRSFKNLSITINGDIKIENILEEALKSPFERNLSPDQDGEPIVRIHKDALDPQMYFYISTKRKEELPIKIITNEIYEIVFKYIHDLSYNHIRYLPSERTGLVYLLSSEVSVDEEPKELINDPKVSSHHLLSFISSLPIGDMISLLKITKDPVRFNSIIEKRMEIPNLKKITNLATILENEIMGGTLKFKKNKSTPEISNLCYQFKESPDDLIELSVTSSSVKDLTPMSVYLKCYLQNRDLIIIDEPEMNLHPKAQAQFIELVGMMINAGIHVILTTHSPYIVDHLSNLIIAETKTNEKNISDLEKLTLLKNRNAFLSIDKVGVYLFDEGTITPLLSESGRIKWGTFGKVSEQLMDIYRNIKYVDDT